MIGLVSEEDISSAWPMSSTGAVRYWNGYTFLELDSAGHLIRN